MEAGGAVGADGICSAYGACGGCDTGGACGAGRAGGEAGTLLGREAGTLLDGEYVPRGIVIPVGDGGEKRSSPRTRNWSGGGDWSWAGTGIWIPHLLQKSLVADS
jgi:hypothetical protein